MVKIGLVSTAGEAAGIFAFVKHLERPAQSVADKHERLAKHCRFCKEEAILFYEEQSWKLLRAVKQEGLTLLST